MFRLLKQKDLLSDERVELLSSRILRHPRAFLMTAAVLFFDSTLG